MKSRWFALPVLAALLLAGCATDSEPSQKEKDRMAKEQQRESQKQAQQQEKMMRQSGQGGSGSSGMRRSR